MHRYFKNLKIVMCISKKKRKQSEQDLTGTCQNTLADKAGHVTCMAGWPSRSAYHWR